MIEPTGRICIMQLVEKFTMAASMSDSANSSTGSTSPNARPFARPVTITRICGYWTSPLGERPASDQTATNFLPALPVAASSHIPRLIV
ncbi:hypothetical protein D3C75_1053060 [compost metagenome]